MIIIIGNVISLIACIIMVISGYIQSKNKILRLQSIQIGLSAVACCVLSAYSGMIINILSVFRNILAQKNKLSWSYKILILSITVTLSIIATLLKSIAISYIDWVGFVPLFSTVTYTLLMDKLDGISFKYLVIFTMVVWIIHDFFSKNYVSVFFNIMNIITSFIAIYKLSRNKKACE